MWPRQVDVGRQMLHPIEAKEGRADECSTNLRLVEARETLAQIPAMVVPQHHVHARRPDTEAAAVRGAPVSKVCLAIV